MGTDQPMAQKPLHEKNQKELYKAGTLVYNGQVIKNDPLAQLEERHLDVVEVTGSSPVGITI